MSNRTKVRHAFFAGIFFWIAVHSLIQDYMGKKAFLQFADEHWVSGTYTVPLALATLLIAVITYFLIKYSFKD